jgi:hypothetical protein
MSQLATELFCFLERHICVKKIRNEQINRSIVTIFRLEVT